MWPCKKGVTIFFFVFLLTAMPLWGTENNIDYQKVTASDTYAAVHGFLDGLEIENAAIAENVLLEGQVFIVDRIRQSAFYGETKLQTINIPDSITYVGEKCFYGCSNLREVVLSKQLKIIQPYLFYNCSNLTNIELPLSVTTIGEGAFQKTGLTEMIISENVTKIGAKAFRDCKNLQSVYFASQETLPDFSVADLIFTGCTNLTHISVATEEMAEKLSVCLASMKNVNPEIEVRISEEEDKENKPEEVPPLEDEEGEEEDKENEPEEVPPLEDEEVEEDKENKEENVVISSNGVGFEREYNRQQKFSIAYKQSALNWLNEWYHEWRKIEILIRKLQQKYLSYNEQNLLLPQHKEVGTFQHFTSML